ncbi:SET domain-containing protein 5, partial [Golovinomyces cichoracearum]
GTLIISEAPLITTTSITSLSPTRTEFELSEALASLPLDQQEAYISLHNNHAETDPAHPLAGIVRSNVYPLGANAKVGGIFLNISRINHSCAPNAVQYWNDLLGRETVYAVKPIDIGEEITLSYYLGGSSVERRQVLLEQFGFWCRCHLCSLPADELAISDRRLERAQELDRLIGDPERCENEPDTVMVACKEMFEIFEQESVRDGRLARLFYDAFQLCNLHSDLARSQCFAEFYYEAKLNSEGAGSHNVLEMLAVRQRPQIHDSFGITNRWKSSVKDRPEFANVDEFRRWLWKY